MDQQNENKSKITTDLNANIGLIKSLFKDDKTLITRYFENQANSSIKFCTFYTDSMVNNKLFNEDVIKPLLEYKFMNEPANKLLILSILFMTFMNGCWNYREIETLALVAGAAMDKGTNNNYHLTLEVLNESGSVGGGGGNGGQGVTSTLIESDGKTIFDAVRNAVRISDKKLYWGSCKVMIISQELAREGIAPLLDFLIRDSEPRLTIDLFVSKEATAKDIIKQKSPVNPITS